MWDAIEIEEWKNIPFISGRVATEQDIKEERAVFYIPTGSESYEIELPLFALKVDEDNVAKTPCIVIQMEKISEGVAVGFRYLDGGNGVGMAKEFEFYSEIPRELSL